MKSPATSRITDFELQRVKYASAGSSRRRALQKCAWIAYEGSARQFNFLLVVALRSETRWSHPEQEGGTAQSLVPPYLALSDPTSPHPSQQTSASTWPRLP